MPMPPVSTSSKNRSSYVHQVGHAVARHAGHVVDDGQPSTGQPIEDARLADVGPADNDNLRNLHQTAKRREGTGTARMKSHVQT